MFDYYSKYKNIKLQGKKQGSYRYPIGTTAVLKQHVIPLEVESVSVHPVQPMDVEPSHSRR